MSSKILQVPDKKLRVKCKEIQIINKSVEKEAFDLLEALKEFDRWYFPVNGLAANQIGLNKRIVIFRTWSRQSITMINPEIISSSIIFPSLEICASIPRTLRLKKRKLLTTVQYQDLQGKIKTLKLFWISSFTMQQEIGHLNGKLIID